MHSRRSLILSALAGAIGLAGAAQAMQTAQADRPYKVVPGQRRRPAKWNLALNNVRNVQRDLGAGMVTAEIVAYGPASACQDGLVVGPRIARRWHSGTVVVACAEHDAARRSSRARTCSGIGYVGAGVVELMVRRKGLRLHPAVARPARARRWGRRCARSQFRACRTPAARVARRPRGGSHPPVGAADSTSPAVICVFLGAGVGTRPPALGCRGTGARPSTVMRR